MSPLLRATHLLTLLLVGNNNQLLGWSPTKITTGTSPTTFSPNEPITRAQLATFLYRYQDSPEVTVNPHSPECGPFTAIGTGGSHSCAIRTDASIACWGRNEHNQADPPEGLFKAISAGNNHSCGLRTDNTIACWGSNWAQRTDTPDGQFSAITAGSYHSCGLRTDATITCWGNNERGQTDAPDGQFAAINAGYDHSCGLRTDNTITCWGYNSNGQTDAPDGQFAAISAGYDHSCGLRTDNTITCWGYNSNGQTDAPTGPFTNVSAGGNHSCGMRADATITCWGWNRHGQTRAPDGQFTVISAGGDNSCGLLVNATVACWGTNWAEQTEIPDEQLTAISAGLEHSCGIRTNTTIACWGGNWEQRTDTPEGQFTAISAGHGHSCGIGSNKTITCWGANESGQSDAPDGQFTAISAGDKHSCGIRTNTTIACWGPRIRPTPLGVQFVFAPGHADPGMCRPFGTYGVTAGFPLPGNALTSKGTVRVAVLFVDFPNAVASHSTQTEAELGLPYAEEYLEASSYGKADFEFVPLHQWLRTERDFEHYSESTAIGPRAVGPPIDAEAARLADPDFDFADYDSVMIVMPSSHFHGGTAGGTVNTDEGTILNTLRVNIFPLDEPREAYQWGSVGAHELTHNLGLLDMYTYDRSLDELPDSTKERTWIESTFGLMGLRVYFPADPQDPRLLQEWRFPDGARTTGYATVLETLEMLAWSRWQLGWLDPAQIRCVTENEATVTLDPVADPKDNIAMAAIPLSGTAVIVIESRHKIGYDNPREERYSDGLTGTFPALITEGVLVYTVDASRLGGQLPLVVAGDTGNLQVDRYPILTDGESVTIRGYTIMVQSSTDSTHTVTITNPPSSAPQLANDGGVHLSHLETR